MAYTIDIEDVVFKIIDVLGDGMAAKLDTIETAKASVNLTLEDIVRYYFGDKEADVPRQNMPCIMVKGRGFIPTPIATNNQYRDNPMRIEIECYIYQDPNATLTVDGRVYDFEEILDIKIMRYARAIVELLRENEQLGGKAISQDFVDVLLSNVIPFEGSMIKACRIEIDILGITNALG